MPTEMREVRLPTELCQSVERRYAERFGNLEQFLVFLMQELMRDDAAQMDRAEQQVIEQRLKDLGYV